MTDTQDSNVNSGGKVSHEINVKRLGNQQKDILRYLYENKDKVWQQVTIIEELYGEVTDSRKASVSRSIGKLRDYGLVDSRKAYLLTPDDHPLITETYWRKQRIHFFITEKGEKFLENDKRFPEIEPK